jgi:hypothetical protein
MNHKNVESHNTRLGASPLPKSPLAAAGGRGVMRGGGDGCLLNHTDVV